MEPGLDRNAFLDHLRIRYPDNAEELSAQFETYLDILREVNAVMDLTAITEPRDIREKHFLDSLLIEPEIKAQAKVADIGSGAGFPGLCLAIVRPDCAFTLIEPTAKRCTFLKRVAQELSLSNVTVLNTRAEDLPEAKESYDVVTARAVANLSVLLELSVPLVQLGGVMIAMKGASADEELAKATNALKILKLDTPVRLESHLPSYGSRINFIFTKSQTTPAKYPRPYRLIKKSPL